MLSPSVAKQTALDAFLHAPNVTSVYTRFPVTALIMGFREISANMNACIRLGKLQRLVKNDERVQEMQFLAYSQTVASV